ncbi:MAG: hypothetical protein Roseis2KO_48080 [Roseivirga sp.]
MTQDILPSLVGRLLQKNRIAFDKTELFFQIQSHPSYPSLHAVTGVLDHFRIENVAASVPTDEVSLSQLPDSFMAQVERDLVIASRTKNGFQVYDSSFKKKLWSTEEFLEKFSGIVVAVESTEESVKKAKKNHLSRIMPVAIGLVLLTFLFVSGPAPASLIFLALALTGTAISIAILKQELGMKTTLGNAFCSDASEKKDCDAVLNSNGATIFGKYKFSDMSMIYFLTLSLTCILAIIQGQSLTASFYLSFLSLPITLYSLYYQWAVVKKWCLLCLSIVGVLWAQAGLALVVTDFSTPVGTISALLLGLVALIVLTAWAYLRPGLEEFQSNQRAHIDYVKFKRNFDLFSTQLQKTDPIQTQIEQPLEIVFGNRKAPLSITLVTNPSCGHCKAAHLLMEDILSQYPEMVKITIRFNINTDNEQGALVKVTSRLLELYEEQGKDICLMAMSEIYGNSSPEEWLEKWSDCIEPQLYVEVLKAGKEWCVEHKINFTPAILINGFSFPRSYERADLIYFIEDLHEATSSETLEAQKSPAEVMV